MEPIIITAILKSKAGFDAQLLAALKKVQPPSRQERGCIKYDLHQSLEGDAFVLYEVWENHEAFENHIQTAHYQEYRETIADIILSREVYKLKAI